MAKRFERQANNVLGRPLDTEFWKSDSAEAVIKTFNDLMELGIDDARASELIVQVWYAAVSEYGD
jgi:hypothetical protein